MKPILFNTDMVRAIMDGRKTATRRVVKPQHLLVLDSPYHMEHPETPDNVLIEKTCKPPYEPGDILYVRETWTTLLGRYIYKANQKPGMKNPGQWRPSIHMPREAARIFLRVTDVRVERLQDITDKDVLSEGVPNSWSPEANRFYFADSVWDSAIKKADHARYGWYANPWVWVIEFERIRKEEAMEHDA